VYSKDGNDIVIIASKAGAPDHPAWYHNLKAHPESVTVEVGAETYAATATIASGAERDRLFNQHATLMPNFRDYEKATSRTIPAVVLKRK
jgi:deazaflavin-dependent oxidoreductase (nitroreductase family)